MEALNHVEDARNLLSSAGEAEPVLVSREEADTPEAIYERAYSVDAMCFGAAPPRNYVPYLTDTKIEALT